MTKLSLANPGDPDESDHDCIQADGSTNIWIDHCESASSMPLLMYCASKAKTTEGIFDDPSGDGLVDLRKDTTLWTVSNSIFRGHDKTFGIGEFLRPFVKARRAHIPRLDRQRRRRGHCPPQLVRRYEPAQPLGR